MEEKFIEEMNKLLEEKKVLSSKYRKDLNKNMYYYILSGIPLLCLYNTSAMLATLSSAPIFIYSLKNLFKLTPVDVKLEFNIRYKNYIEETTCYKEALKEYREIILKLSDLFDKNKINSLVDIQSSFVFMQKNGYLSENHSWKYRSLIEKMHLKNLGIPIISGCGVCRDLSYMFNDLLKNMDFYTIPLLIKSDWIEGEERLYSLSSIENLCQSFNIDLSNIPEFLIENDKIIYPEQKENDQENEISHKKNSFNHVIVSTEYKGEVYHFDPTNHLYFKNYDKKHITFYEQDKSLRISFREYRKEKKKLLSLSNPNKVELYNLYNEYYLKNLLERERIFQEFYEANKESYQRVNEKVKMINKYWK